MPFQTKLLFFALFSLLLRVVVVLILPDVHCGLILPANSFNEGKSWVGIPCMGVSFYFYKH